MDERSTGLVLEMTGRLAASPERVFYALIEPAELARWWGPRGFTTSQIEVDLGVGGHYRFTMRPPEGEPFALTGEFLEVHAPSRLSYTFRWEPPDPDDRETVVVLALEAVGDGTRLFLSQGEFATEERLELHRSGWSDSLEKLRRLVE